MNNKTHTEERVKEDKTKTRKHNEHQQMHIERREKTGDGECRHILPPLKFLIA
jgi:hypothetical protein